MHRHDGTVLYSASDLVAFLGCEHSVTLSLRNLETPLPRATDDESAQLVKEKGMEHERRVLAQLKASGQRVVEIEGHEDPRDLAARTEAAMREGADVVYQGAFLVGSHYGRTDFLRRVNVPSRLGGHSYEVLDTKLALSPKGKFAVQLAFYSDLLSQVQGEKPKQMHVILGDEREESLRVADYEHYVAEIRGRFGAFVSAKPATKPEKCEACGLCAWRDICDKQWKDEDHLNQVAAIRRDQIHKLHAAGIVTLAQLAASPEAQVSGMPADTVRRLAAQAALQRARKQEGPPVYEALPLDPDGRRGFHRMPRPDAGDLFFDMEGNPYEKGGLEYLFGVRYDDGAGPQFRAFWAHDRQAERKAFEDFVDFVVERVKRHPDLHVYHYNHYEPTALKRLMTFHGTHEAEVDQLLRDEKFVDLYTVVRQALRTSEPGLSIKDLEVFYMPPREGDIKDAGASVVSYERWKVTKDDAELESIRAYNEDDCRSTHLLRDWLLKLRPAEVTWFVPGDRDGATPEKSDRVKDIEATLEGYREALVADVPAKDEDRSREERVRALVFALLDFHRREAKPGYWNLFARRFMPDEDLVEDIECLGALRRTTTAPQATAKSHLYEYAFPEQETKLRKDKQVTRCDTAEGLGSIHDLDETALRVVLKISKKKEAPERLSIGPEGPIKTDSVRNAVWRFADAMIAGDTSRFRAGRAFLDRAPPAFKGRRPGAPVIEGREELFVEAHRAVAALDESYLFIQGPPGSGKTTIGSQLIVALMRAGKRVGVTSNSHKVIHNLLDAVEERAKELDFSFKGLKKSGSDADSSYTSPHIETVDHNSKVDSDAQLIAGTAWLFADERLESRIDYLFVDEAGQVSLANLMAVSTSARNLVLLGDHMQLGQPIQGTHPDGAGQSALDYLLDGEATVAKDRGIFLPRSYRMHEDVCRFISASVYDGRLDADERNQTRRLLLDGDAHPVLRPSGIRFVAVEHTGCAQSNRVEAEELRTIFANLLTQRWIDKEGDEHDIAINDILVVAPYNAQVNLLRDVLPKGARIGTIDKFQGQEAPVVLVSMTSSSGEDLPRGIEFLYEKNRLNVAVSRAKCLAVVFASPALLHVDCATPEQMALVNMLCWLRDHADAMPGGAR